MSKEDIIKQLDNLLENKNSRGFLNHLVKSYLPVTKVDKVFLKPKGTFKCSISNKPLISVNEIISGMETEEYKDNFFKWLHNSMDPETKVDAPIKTLLGNKMLAVQGTNTDTLMALPVYHVFQEWIINKMLMGDKHINWLMRDLTPFGKKKQVKPKALTKEVGATFALGDMDVLQKLKESMKKEGY